MSSTGGMQKSVTERLRDRLSPEWDVEGDADAAVASRNDDRVAGEISVERFDGEWLVTIVAGDLDLTPVAPPQEWDLVADSQHGSLSAAVGEAVDIAEGAGGNPHGGNPHTDVRDEVTRAIDERVAGINDREFRVIVPKFDNAGQKIRVGLIQNIAERISRRFGGVTVIPTTLGCFQPEDGDLICEENVIFSTVRDSEDGVNVRDDEVWMRELAHDIGEEFGQIAVMVSEDVVESQFVSGDFAERLPEEKVGRDAFRELI